MYVQQTSFFFLKLYICRRLIVMVLHRGSHVSRPNSSHSLRTQLDLQNRKVLWRRLWLDGHASSSCFNCFYFKFSYAETYAIPRAINRCSSAAVWSIRFCIGQCNIPTVCSWWLSKHALLLLCSYDNVHRSCEYAEVCLAAFYGYSSLHAALNLPSLRSVLVVALRWRGFVALSK